MGDGDTVMVKKHAMYNWQTSKSIFQVFRLVYLHESGLTLSELCTRLNKKKPILSEQLAYLKKEPVAFVKRKEIEGKVLFFPNEQRFLKRFNLKPETEIDGFLVWATSFEHFKEILSQPKSSSLSTDRKTKNLD